MKKQHIITIIIFIGSISAFAQSTRIITGAVIDKNGNPLPGAIVEATGGAESAIVDADGTFSIEVPIWLESLTAKYSGMETKKYKIHNTSVAIIKMKPEGYGQWFVNLEGAYVIGDGIESGRLGIMGGYLGKWGGYAKIMPTFYPGYGTPAATAGVIKSISKTVYGYLGIGYAPSVGHDDRFDWGDYEDGIMVDLGCIIKINKHFDINVGYSFSHALYEEEYECHDIHFGVGYCF